MGWRKKSEIIAAQIAISVCQLYDLYDFDYPNIEKPKNPINGRWCYCAIPLAIKLKKDPGVVVKEIIEQINKNHNNNNNWNKALERILENYVNTR